ncbi:MAG: MmcQ/YjbR family DNA-binding protein [Saprospiraceae bacterium]|nr:MmcQ/YjbR family DNA-binding protein [Saprospiraceae bacterium]
MPHTSEGIKYGDQICFMVAGKSFCSIQIKALEKVKFKVPNDDFEMFCEREGVKPAPYGGVKFKWVQVDDFPFLTEKEWLFWVQQSYDLIKNSLPKKVLAQF